MDLELFRFHLLAKSCSPHSVRQYLRTVAAFARWAEETNGTFDLSAITSLDIADYRRHLLDHKKKPATINNALDILRAYFGWTVQEGVAQRNPVAGVKRVAEQKRAPRWLTRREMSVLVGAVQKYGSKRDQALIVLLLHTGLRVAEACSLTLDDVLIRERSGMVHVREGKGGKYREIPLNVTVRKVLAEYLAGLTGEWLFPGRKGRMTTRTAERIVGKYARLAGIEATPHQLRHVFCKRLLDQGVSLDQVAVLAGHSNLNTTAKYVRPSVQDLEKAVDRLSWE